MPYKNCRLLAEDIEYTDKVASQMFDVIVINSERLAGLAVRMEVARRTRKQQRPIARLPRQKAFCGAHLRPMGCMAHALGAMHE